MGKKKENHAIAKRYNQKVPPTTLGWIPTLNRSYLNYTKHQKRKRGNIFQEFSRRFRTQIEIN